MEFSSVKGNADVHFEHAFEQEMDKLRRFTENKTCTEINMYAFMVQLKSYLELFSIFVYKYSQTEPESTLIFDAFHNMETRFAHDPTVRIASYPNVKIENRLNYHNYK
jgi:hypothetical protein